MCTPTVQADHKAIEAATTVTVSVTVTCYQIAYAQQDFLPGVIHAQQEQVNQLYGYAYHLVGDMLAESPVYSLTDASSQTAEVSVKANSMWMYQVDNVQKARIAQEIVGQSTDDARNLLLSKEKDFLQDVTISLQGFGAKLPEDAHAIQVTVQAVSGLHA